MPTNTAAWLGPRHARLETRDAPYTRPAHDEIVVENHAVAVNPLDWILQVAGNLIYPWIKYPFILGSDVAGVVAEIGSAVTRFKVGDRVLAHAVGSDRDSNSSARGAFQTYTVVLERLAAPIPGTLAYADAAVLPLALSTAASGLFQKEQLGLDPPSANPTPTGRTVLVWGGSTSVGSNAIQLAVAAGYEVVTTASPRNFGYVTTLGACQVYDYNSASVVQELITALDGKTVAGAIAIGRGSAQRCADVLRACTGTRFIAMATAPIPFDELADRRRGRLRLLRVLPGVVSSSMSLLVTTRMRGIRTKAIFGSAVKNTPVGTCIYEDFLPAALAEGRYLAAPPPYVVGTGLEHIQAGLDAQLRGVSAQKVVISL